MESTLAQSASSRGRMVFAQLFALSESTPSSGHSPGSRNTISGPIPGQAFKGLFFSGINFAVTEFFLLESSKKHACVRRESSSFCESKCPAGENQRTPESLMPGHGSATAVRTLPQDSGTGKPLTQYTIFIIFIESVAPQFLLMGTTDTTEYAVATRRLLELE